MFEKLRALEASNSNSSIFLLIGLLIYFYLAHCQAF